MTLVRRLCGRIGMGLGASAVCGAGVPALLGMLLSGAAAGGAAAADVLVKSSWGCLRDGVPVLPVDASASDYLEAPGLKHVKVWKPVRDFMGDINQTPAIVAEGSNTFVVSGVDEATRTVQTSEVTVWGDTTMSLLLRATLVDVRILPDNRAELDIAIHPDTMSGVAPIGRMLFDRVDIDVLAAGRPVGHFRPAVATIGDQQFALDMLGMADGGSILGDGDCPFTITTDDAALDPIVAAQLASQLAGDDHDLLVVISGFAAGAPSDPQAYFSERVATDPLGPVEAAALLEPQPCQWSQDPPQPVPPPVPCQWKLRQIGGTPPPAQEIPGVTYCATRGKVSTPSELFGVDRVTIWTSVLSATAKSIFGRTHVDLVALGGLAGFTTPWYGCAPDADGGKFVIRRVGECGGCDCNGVVSGSAQFITETTVAPYGTVAVKGDMVLKFSVQPPAVASGTVVHQNNGISMGAQIPIVGSLGYSLVSGEGTQRFPFIGLTSEPISDCIIYFHTKTACVIQSNAVTTPLQSSSFTIGSIEDSKFQVDVISWMPPNCGPEMDPVAVPITLP